MKLENQDLIQEFYEKNKHVYPNMTFQQVKDCISTPYLYARQNMELDGFPVIRLKYLCTFAPSLGKIKQSLITMKNAFDLLRLEARIYFPRKKVLEDYVAKQENIESINLIDDYTEDE